MTAKIVTHSLANFVGNKRQMHQRARPANLKIRDRKKQIDVSFSLLCPVIDHEFRHTIFKVAV